MRGVNDLNEHPVVAGRGIELDLGGLISEVGMSADVHDQLVDRESQPECVFFGDLGSLPETIEKARDVGEGVRYGGYP